MSADERRRLPPRLDPRRGRGSGGSDQGDRRDPRGGSVTRRAAVVTRVFCGLLSVAILAGTGWGWNLARIAESSVNRTDAIPSSGNTDSQGSQHAGTEMNLLLVGMDSRTGLTAAQQAELNTGDPDGVLNTDTMLLVHVPADGSAASFVSFPRDMYVSVPDHGKGKLNSAYADGYNGTEGSDTQKDGAGAQLLIRTISQLSGLQIDHFAEVNLLGFFNLSNIVGGVQVNLCAPVDDSYSGANFPAGVQTISGADALKFVRQRHGLPRGDIDRVVRQQVYIAGLIRNVLSSQLLLNLSKQKQIVEQVGGSITVDQGLNLFDLAAQMQGVQPGNITFQTVPGLTDATVPNWGSVLQLPDQAVLTRFFSSLTATPAQTTAPATTSTSTSTSTSTIRPDEITVRVANGSGKAGAAASAATALASAGFLATSGGNAASTGTTTVRYRTGDDATAAVLATQVPGAALTVDDSVAAGTVDLVLGSDYVGIGQPVTAPAETTVPNSYASNERTAQDTSCIN